MCVWDGGWIIGDECAELVGTRVEVVFQAEAGGVAVSWNCLEAICEGILNGFLQFQNDQLVK